MNSEDALTHLLTQYGVQRGSDPARLLVEYLRILRRWNARVNLTASSEWEALAPLFQEAVWAAGVYPPSRQSHLDIGSGAGFPALPLKILRPEMDLEMVESRTKRAVFLESVVHNLGLSAIQVHNERLENFLARIDSRQQWSIISWKALRMKRMQFSLLRRHTTKQTQFWIFHGKDLPLAQPRVSLAGLSLVQQLRCPFARKSFLSIYR